MYYFANLLDYSFNSEQANNSEYEQYLSVNDRNYEAYGRTSVVEEEDSESINDFVHDDVTYGQDAFQECSLYMLRSYNFVLRVPTTIEPPLFVTAVAWLLCSSKKVSCYAQID